MISPPPVGPDGYIDSRADMRLLVTVSSCPSDIATVNDFRIKPLKVLLFESP
ncbi:MAG TPA: hypothetical protein VFW86_04345 [Candidatus Limnocylindrales bacterium]|nr:hypothetical protein [Candidatus Limnocylindrales bacterium]